MKKFIFILGFLFSFIPGVFAQVPSAPVDLGLPPVNLNNPAGSSGINVPPPTLQQPAGSSGVNIPPTTINNPAGGTNPGPGAQPVTQPQSTGSFLHIDSPSNHGLPSGTLETMIQRVLDNALSLVALIGIAGLIFAAIQLWLAQGKADGIGHAKVNIFNIVLGFAIVLLAWSGVTVVLKFLGF